jgi:hypothetical protein
VTAAGICWTGSHLTARGIHAAGGPIHFVAAQG